MWDHTQDRLFVFMKNYSLFAMGATQSMSLIQIPSPEQIKSLVQEDHDELAKRMARFMFVVMQVTISKSQIQKPKLCYQKVSPTSEQTQHLLQFFSLRKKGNARRYEHHNTNLNTDLSAYFCHTQYPKNSKYEKQTRHPNNQNSRQSETPRQKQSKDTRYPPKPRQETRQVRCIPHRDKNKTHRNRNFADRYQERYQTR